MTTAINSSTNAAHNAQLLDKIRSINYHQIRLIGNYIVNQILPNLGHIGCAHVMHQTLNGRAFYSESEREVGIIKEMAAEHQRRMERENFFSDEEFARVHEYTLTLITEGMSFAFSNPESVLSQSLLYRLSNDRSQGFFDWIDQEFGIEINPCHVPAKYWVILNLDKALSQAQSTLVFHLIQTSQDLEFSRHTFTIESLS